MFVKYSLTFVACLTTLLLAGCGSGTTDQVINSITPPALADGSGGSFFGYYLQSDDVVDPVTNIGGLYFTLPSSDGTWSGRMSFQFFDCQHTNALSLNGQKLTAYLKTLPPYNIGALDSVTLANPNTTIVTNFSGRYSRTNDNYEGDYTRIDKSGDDRRTVENCGSYTIADKGKWQVYKETQIFPVGFDLTQTGDLLNWSFVATANKTVIMILDPAKIISDNNAVVRQIVTTAAPNTINLVNSSVTRGQPYLVVVELFDINNAPVAFKTLTVSF